MNRRRLLEGSLLGATALAFAAPQVSWAKSFMARPATVPVQLRIARRTIEVNGRAASVFGFASAEWNARPGLAGGGRIQCDAGERYG